MKPREITEREKYEIRQHAKDIDLEIVEELWGWVFYLVSIDTNSAEEILNQLKSLEGVL